MAAGGRTPGADGRKLRVAQPIGMVRKTYLSLSPSTHRPLLLVLSFHPGRFGLGNGSSSSFSCCADGWIQARLLHVMF
ncbi:hypothetical protein [Synechococcus sp. UW179A]|uniref:hypothetical protein n=1 Tax=Synechococcus sp. UW179A TaxID=2575510 RepID=UPI0010BE613F|nr:hypothetical protein [Synechococcus sp. UW179A]